MRGSLPARLLARDRDALRDRGAGAIARTAAASSPKTARSAASSGVARGSLRCPRQSPCRASRPLRRARGSTRADRAIAAGGDRARGRAWRRRCRRRGRGRGSAAPSARRRRAAPREVRAARVLVDGFGDLHGQLARRHQDEPPRAPAARGCAMTAVDHRQRKGRGLAGAGAGLRQQVAARQKTGSPPVEPGWVLRSQAGSVPRSASRQAREWRIHR